MGFLPGSNHKDLQVASDHYLTDGPGGTCKALLPHSQGDLRQATASLLDYEHLPPRAGLGIRTVSWSSAHTMLGVTRSLWQTPLRWRLRRTSAPSDEGNYKSDRGCLAFTIRTHEWGFGIFSHTLSFVCLWENILRRSLSLLDFDLTESVPWLRKLCPHPILSGSKAPREWFWGTAGHHQQMFVGKHYGNSREKGQIWTAENGCSGDWIASLLLRRQGSTYWY